MGNYLGDPNCFYFVEFKRDGFGGLGKGGLKHTSKACVPTVKRQNNLLQNDYSRANIGSENIFLVNWRTGYFKGPFICSAIQVSTIGRRKI